MRMIINKKSNGIKQRAADISKHYTGFPDRTATSLSWADGTYTLTLTATTDPIWINGKDYYINTLTKQLTVGQEAATGLYWFWLTVTGGVVSLNCDAAQPGFDVCLVATVYWNTTTSKGLLSDERHWMGRDQWMHEYLHETVGARYYTGLTGTFTDTTFSITAGEFYDEDIEHQCSSDSPMAYPGTAMTTCKNMYHNGDADWVWGAASTTIYKATGGVLNYNNGNTLATCDNNKYVNYWVFITAGTAEPVHSFIGTAQYTTIALARAATIPNLGSLASAENKIIYKVTYRQVGAAPLYIEATDYRTASQLQGTSFVATDHGTLTGLSDDDHAIYLLATDATDRTTFATNWTDLTDSGATTLHTHADASTTVKGIVELAIDSEVTTGTSNTLAVTPDALAGSGYGKRVVEMIVVGGTTDLAVGDKAGGTAFRVPPEMNGWNLVGVAAHVETAGTTGTTDIQIRNVTQTADMLSTKITIDSGETDTSSAATAAVIDTNNDDVATADKIAIDIDAISTTAPKGLTVTLIFQLP